MGTITLPNFRTTADVTMNTRLKDGGLYIDLAELTDIKAWLWSDAQKALAGRCDARIDAGDSTKLICEYASTKAQYPGVNRLIVQATYRGATKTYDKPVFNFVRWTADQSGNQITIDDPEIDVEIEVQDVSSSILDNILAACLKATAEAREVVDVHRGPAAGFGTVDAEADDNVGDPEVEVETSGDDAAKNFHFKFKSIKGQRGDRGPAGVEQVVVNIVDNTPGTPSGSAVVENGVMTIELSHVKGEKGNTGVSADYPITIHNGLDSDATDEALAAAQGKVLKEEIDDIDEKVDILSAMGVSSLAKKLPDISFLSDAVYEKGNYIKRNADLSSVQILSFKADGTYGTSTSYYHADVIVFPGEVVRVKANANAATRVAFVSDLNCPYSGGPYSLVAGTSAVDVSAGTESVFVVPSGAVAMKVYLGSESGGVYAGMPEFVYIYRAKDAVIIPQSIVMDKYGYNSSDKMVYVSGATGYAFPVESGKKYLVKVTGAGTAAKYSIQTAGSIYRNMPVNVSASPNSDFSTANSVLNLTATVTGLWTITKYSGGSFSVVFEEVTDTVVRDADMSATANFLDYKKIEITNLTYRNFYIASKTGLWTSSNTYKSVTYPVVPGQLLKVVPSESYNAILIWLAGDTAPETGALPDYLPAHQERMTLPAGSGATIIRVPEGANYVYIYTGTANASNVPLFFGIAEEQGEADMAGEVSSGQMDYCAYNDKQILLAQNRDYYFDDTYASEQSYVDTSYLDRKMAEVPDGKHFIFVTDSHIDYTNFIGREQNETPVIKFVRDRLGIRNVVFGGDAIGVQPTKYRAAKVLSIYAKEKFEAFGRDFLFVMGNHDANPFIPDGGTIADALIDDEEIYARTSKFMEDYGIAVFPEKVIKIIDETTTLLDNAGNVISADEKRAFRAWAKLNYYYDDDTQGIRYIVLETGDAGWTLRNICNTKTDGQYSLPLVASFFVDALKSVPKDYDVVVVGHEIVDTGAFWTKVFYKVLAAYKNKQSVSVDFRINNDTNHPAVSPIVRSTFDSGTLNGLTIDMTRNVGSGRVFCLSGHVHYDRAQIKKYVSDSDAIDVSSFPLSTSNTPQSLTYSENSILHIKCDRCCATQRSSADWENYTGAYSYPNQGTGEGEVQRIGNVTEVLFDVVTITPDNRVVLTRFGAHGPVEGDKYVRDYVMPVPTE